MNEKEVLVRLVDIKNDMMIRAYYTSTPVEHLKMYDYFRERENYSIHISENLKDSEDKYNNTDAFVKDIDINFGGEGCITCINIYVEVF